MTSGLLVSTEMKTADSRRSASMTGMTRAISSSSGAARGAGPRRLAADIDDGSALLDHPSRMAQRGVAIVEAAAVGKGIGRDIEHTHHHGSAEIDGPIPALPLRDGAHGERPPAVVPTIYS